MDPLRLTLRQLQVFVAVANTGSTTAASSEIALSQSATSAAVNELERLLSMRLFDRVGRRLALNDNGRALLERARALLEGARDVERMARDAGDQLQALRIGASTTIGNHVLPDLLAAFLGGGQFGAARWRSSVAIGNTRDICARVAEFDLDVGLIEGACHESALEVHPWLRDVMVVVAAPAPRRAAPQRLPVQALRDAVWLLREPGSGTREATDQALLPHLRAYRRCIELGSSEAIKHAAAAGIGFACLSRWVVADWLDSGRLREVATTLPAITRQCYWVVHRDKHHTPALRRMIDAVAGGAKTRSRASGA
jgi:DNA-binding transcriptional LysR family regulator